MEAMPRHASRILVTGRSPSERSGTLIAMYIHRDRWTHGAPTAHGGPGIPGMAAAIVMEGQRSLTLQAGMSGMQALFGSVCLKCFVPVLATAGISLPRSRFLAGLVPLGLLSMTCRLWLYHRLPKSSRDITVNKSGEMTTKHSLWGQLPGRFGRFKISQDNSRLPILPSYKQRLASSPPQTGDLTSSPESWLHGTRRSRYALITIFPTCLARQSTCVTFQVVLRRSSAHDLWITGICCVWRYFWLRESYRSVTQNSFNDVIEVRLGSTTGCRFFLERFPPGENLTLEVPEGGYVTLPCPRPYSLPEADLVLAGPGGTLLQEGTFRGGECHSLVSSAEIDWVKPWGFTIGS
ncbi:hypothetical protein RRG08_049083 [Elysia crispata]|uniref:Uncharacterized protein n=1 Tax=Elysia crispata TaxID=231223 RepID=A0AAE1AAE5_9GAST|nr:hypothetical protein RRG08_049083 [Elysia crispata]